MKKSIENIDPIPICQRLEKLRRELGFDNKSKFARYLDVSPQTYQNYESDRIPPSDVIYKIAAKFKRSVDLVWLFTGEKQLEEPSKPIPLDPVLLKQIIDGVEKHLDEEQWDLATELKAKAIAILYDHYAETGEKVDQGKVVHYLKLVA